MKVGVLVYVWFAASVLIYCTTRLTYAPFSQATSHNCEQRINQTQHKNLRFNSI